MMNIILASSSPRRAFLLGSYGFKFKIISPNINENINSKTPVQLVKKLAVLKSEKVKQQIQNRDYIIIAADTVVAIKNTILGCPSSLQMAKKYLRQLSSKTHNVYTGVSIIIGDNKPIVFSEKTLVTFNKLSESLINYYINNYKVLDKAGGYGIQEGGILLIRKINGSYSNVMGLPIDRVVAVLGSYLTD